MSAQGRSRPIEVLLVEDNPGDVRLTREALKDGKVSNNLSVMQDGVEALRFLRREGPDAGAPRPDLVLLDLNLPKKDGPLLQDEQDRSLAPSVVVLTIPTRSAISARRAAGQRYITKPVDLTVITAVKSSRTLVRS